METRKMMDCRRYPNPEGCTLTISGREDEVLDMALLHGLTVHGFPDNPDVRTKLKGALQEEHALVPEPGRKVADCRTMPSDLNCSLTLAGREDEVLRAATDHAVASHQHPRSPELGEAVRAHLTSEQGTGESYTSSTL